MDYKSEIFASLEREDRDRSIECIYPFIIKEKKKIRLVGKSVVLLYEDIVSLRKGDLNEIVL